jgi:hypothetical protein
VVKPSLRERRLRATGQERTRALSPSYICPAERYHFHFERLGVK